MRLFLKLAGLALLAILLVGCGQAAEERSHHDFQYLNDDVLERLDEDEINRRNNEMLEKIGDEFVRWTAQVIEVKSNKRIILQEESLPKIDVKLKDKVDDDLAVGDVVTVSGHLTKYDKRLFGTVWTWHMKNGAILQTTDQEKEALATYQEALKAVRNQSEDEQEAKEQEKQQQEAQEAKEEEKEAAEQATPIQEDITLEGGLGDRISKLERHYGDYENQSSRVSFKEGYIYSYAPYSMTDSDSISSEDLIWNLTVSFEMTDDAARTKDEVLSIAKSFLPKDAVKVEESEVVLSEEYKTTVLNYKSELLAKRITDQSLYGDAEIGSFVLHLDQYTGNDFEKGYFQLKITTGNPQP